MRLKADAPRRLRLLIWNCKVGRRPRRVRKALQKFIKAKNPHAIMLQEAQGYIAELGKIKGYRLVHASGPGEVRANVILVRCDIPATYRGAIWCSEPWTGPKAGKAHRGRVMPVVDLGSRWRLPCVHRTRPGWSKGSKAFIEEYNKLLASARSTPPSMAWAAGGDHNLGTRKGSDRGKYTPWAMARALRGRIGQASPGRVDMVITHRARIIRVQQLAKRGSDHNALFCVLQWGAA